ncbi:MAG: hypothetical protein QOG07_2260 [Pseudonocardiales bacterium]|jgi:hypothetical protein|nr:hypothetical protein [Pseudonocardiales bacterium]
MGDPEEPDYGEDREYRTHQASNNWCFRLGPVRHDELWLHGPTVMKSVRRSTHRTDQLSNPDGR